ncbi:MAG: 4-hydroxy-2-oxo-heptane-1,7-dioate aldolase, partial [Rhodospirillaceae bacterium]|nr:4-hydroxy-2-oxo-heptane-1,7-dioate aldolase [Rhodospirillaceae bacterium]
GVLVPRVSSAADARAAVAATRYPPVGERGVGPGRAAAYGAKIEEAIADANANVVLAVQLETAEGLARVDEIAAVDGVDAIYIGPGDLAASLGALGPQGRPVLEKAVATIVDSCKRHGRAVGIFTLTPESLTGAIEQGMTFVTLGSDAMLLGRGLNEAADAARKARG